MVRILNTLSNKKENLRVPKKEVRLFVCGPTVYDYPHIGHARTYVVFDAFAKFLIARGYAVSYLQNITDIDDKIIDRANAEKIPAKALAKMFEDIYHEDEKALGITAVSTYARATDSIPAIIDQITRLIKKGHAYCIPKDGYYFDITTFKDYGKLSHRTVLQAQDSVSRIDEGIQKRNKGDFALWKFSRPGEPSWNTPLGKGRPGWHIEDTAITESHFGPQYTIHGGALDLKFPHHEAEIAQQECASGKKPMVKIWMHTGFLLTKGAKMSKSLKNFVTIRDFLNIYPKEVLRLMALAAYYRSPIDFTDTTAEQAQSQVTSIKAFLIDVQVAPLIARGPAIDTTNYKKKFLAELENDFNTPRALAVMYSLTNQVRMHIKKGLSKRTRTGILSFFELVNSIFGIIPKQIEDIIPAAIIALLEKRELARTQKRWNDADVLRTQIQKLGFTVEDTEVGPRLKKIGK